MEACCRLVASVHDSAAVRFQGGGVLRGEANRSSREGYPLRSPKLSSSSSLSLSLLLPVKMMACPLLELLVVTILGSVKAATMTYIYPVLLVCFLKVTISGAAKVATTKEEFQELKAAQAKSDVREKFANSGLGDVDPEERLWWIGFC